jgi:hypothetical protein
MKTMRINKLLRQTLLLIVCMTIASAIAHAQCGWTLNNYDIYYACGNVGIGTTVPQAKLELNLGSVSSWARAIYVTNTASDGRPFMYIGDDSNHGMVIGHTKNGSDDYGWLSYYGFDTSAGQGLILANNGNVGIMTTTPAQSLEIGGGNIILGACPRIS